MAKKFMVVVILVLNIWCVGCCSIVTQCESVDIFPSGVELKSGDIIVARGDGLFSAAMASLGEPTTPFGHTGVYFKNEAGCGRIIHMQPEGLTVVSLQEFWGSYYRKGLIRVKSQSGVDSDKFDSECWKIIEYSKCNNIGAGFWGESLKDGEYAEEGEYPSNLYCIALVNLLYMKSGQPRPFEKTFDISGEPLLRLVFGEIDEKASNMLVIESLFANDKFELISDHSSSEIEEQGGRVEDNILLAINTYLGSGYTLKKPPFHISVGIGLGYGITKITMPILPSGVKNMLREMKSINMIAVIYVLSKYDKLVYDESMKVLLAGDGADIKAVTLATANKYRRRAFND